MRILLQILYLITASAVPSLVALLILVRRYREPVPAAGKRVPTSELLSPSGGYWKIDLQNLADGRIFEKFFRRSLILGRQVSDLEYTGTLAIGTESYISREQCQFIVTNEGIVVSNLSRANATLCNGHAINRPVFVRVGDEIGVGNSHFRILSLARIA